MIATAVASYPCIPGHVYSLRGRDQWRAGGRANGAPAPGIQGKGASKE